MVEFIVRETTKQMISYCLIVSLWYSWVIIFVLQRASSRASPCTNVSKQAIGNNVTNHNNTPLSAATTTCVSTITNTVTTVNTVAHRDVVTCSLPGRNSNNSPRGHSPNRERDSYRYITAYFSFLCLLSSTISNLNLKGM